MAYITIILYVSTMVICIFHILKPLVLKKKNLQIRNSMLLDHPVMTLELVKFSLTPFKPKHLHISTCRETILYQSTLH